MGLGQYKNHEHFIEHKPNNQMVNANEVNLNHKLALDSLHSHGPNLEGGKYPPSYYIYYSVFTTNITLK